MDFDTIVVRDIYPLYKLLDTYDFIGFGCYFKDSVCLKKTGFPNPANWVLISRRNNPLFKRCVEMCDHLLDNNGSGYFEYNYHVFGKDLLPAAIEHTTQTITNWKYYHFPSTCLERNSLGIKLRNNLLISKIDIDPLCKDKYYFIPIYNTAPGFPGWFRKMPQDQILRGEFLISKMFRLALSYPHLKIKK
jgi:hypothetical protein